MAVAPLFVLDMETLQAKLRLTGLPSGADGEALLKSGVERAKAQFYRRLGLSRVTTLLAMTYTDTPATQEDVLRIVANEAEVKAVRLHLLDTMPVLFMDNSTQTEEVWNTEGAFRPGRITLAERERLATELEADMALLAGETSLGSETTWGGFTLEPDCPPPAPGDSMFGAPDRAWPVEDEEG